MRDIEGIEKVVARLKPHMAEIEVHFNAENARFIELMSRPHDVVGRLLKCHLVVEHYLGRFLSEHFEIEYVESAKLGFFNKAMLLPSTATSAAFVKPGILKLNTLRNRVGHNLGSDLTFGDLGPINDVLTIARAGAKFVEPIEAIEAFTTVACTWLVGIACCRISGNLSGFCVTRADMKSAHGAPIVTSGSLSAGRVTSVSPC